jgi:hypothetical protein
MIYSQKTRGEGKKNFLEAIIFLDIFRALLLNVAIIGNL